MTIARRAWKKVGADRRRQRGMTLLIALGVIAVATAATLVSLRIVSQESDLQGRERHSREAFFAAEAGMSEGREVLTKLTEQPDNKERNFSHALSKLRTPKMGKPGFDVAGAVAEDGFDYEDWFEVIPRTAYTMQKVQAMDEAVTAVHQEFRDANGKPFLSFPEQMGVHYRVFVHDDDDINETGDANLSQKTDSNAAVWVVSVGEVLGGKAGDAKRPVLARAVVRALVLVGKPTAIATGYGGQAGGGDTKGGSVVEKNPPNASDGTYLP